VSAIHPASAIPPALLTAIRLSVAAIWLYEGLWLKIVHPVPHEVAVVESVAFGSLTPERLLALIGGGETLMGLGVLSGLYPRFLAWFQGSVLVLMNGIGIAFSHGAIADPLGLVLKNLPLLLCIIVLGLYSPGAPTWLPVRGKR
jgi:uncharacterized membrane protein YphA (DoxX/SURF4 family)